MKHKFGHAVWVERGVHAEVKEELEIEAVCTGVRRTTQQKAAEGTPFCHAGRDVELRRSAGANCSVWAFGWWRQRRRHASSNRHQG